MGVLRKSRGWDDLRRAGIVFHGTASVFDHPRGGGYDGVFWTALTPAVAQSYIPRAGVHYEMEPFVRHPSMAGERLRPEPFGDDAITAWALDRCGVTLADLDMTVEHGRAVSWRIPKGWPTLAEADAWLRDEMGYGAPERGRWRVREHQGRIMPAGWSMPGRLLVCLLPEAAEARMADWSAGSMHLYTHNRLQDFARMERAGRRTFLMNDTLQSEVMGNLGHLSVGILPAALPDLKVLSIPAVNHDGELEVFTSPGTPAFRAFMERECPDFDLDSRPAFEIHDNDDDGLVL